MSTLTELDIMKVTTGNVEQFQPSRRKESNGAVHPVPPRNEVEKHLALLWADVLEIPPDIIGVRDNFFDLGGQALDVAAVISKLCTSLKIHLPLTILFKCPTIETMAGSLIKSFRLNSGGHPFSGDLDKISA